MNKSKKELRRSVLQLRQQYTEEECDQWSRQIAELFFNNTFFDLSKVKYLHLFLPIRHKNEVDTFPILHKLLEEYPSIHVVLSISDFEECTMSHFIYTKNTELKKNKYGIPEPITGDPVDSSLIDIVLVPLVVADKQGNRIGYGKGFYDRFLVSCRTDCKKIGLSFEAPVEQIFPEEFDIPLDFCITPDKIYTFKN